MAENAISEKAFVKGRIFTYLSAKKIAEGKAPNVWAVVAMSDTQPSPEGAIRLEVRKALEMNSEVRPLTFTKENIKFW